MRTGIVAATVCAGRHSRTGPTGSSAKRTLLALTLSLVACSPTVVYITPSPTVAPTASPTPTATPVPTPTPVPTIRPVTLKPEQVIVPLGESPIAGYKVAEDAAEGLDKWHRKFVPFAQAEYWWVDVAVDIYPSAASRFRQIERGVAG